MFLVADTLGCYLTEDDYRDCHSLELANYIVTFQLVASALFYLCTEISTLHMSYEDTVALRNVDAGYVFRLLAQAATWVSTPLRLRERAKRAQRQLRLTPVCESVLTSVRSGPSLTLLFRTLSLCR